MAKWPSNFISGTQFKKGQMATMARTHLIKSGCENAELPE